jgi:hypothetical protein
MRWVAGLYGLEPQAPPYLRSFAVLVAGRG